MIRKHFFILLVVIAAAGLLLRLQVCRELLDSDIQVSRPSAGTDMATYMDLSEKIMRGEYSGEFYYQPFYYAVFLPLAHKIMGAGPWPVMLAQALLSALTIIVASVSSAMLWGRKAGLATAVLSAFSAALVLYVPYQLIETLQAFWIIMILYVSLVAWRSGRILHWGILGALVSLSILTRGNTWFFVPGILLAAIASGFSGKWTKETPSISKHLLRIAPALVFILMVLLPQLPFSLRNSQITGRFCGPSTAAGAVLALGNTPEAPPGGRNPGLGPGPMEYPETYHAWMAKVKELSVAGQILEWFKREPAAFLELQFRKMLLFWDRREIPNNIAFEYQGEKSATFKNFAFVPTSIIMALALACMFYFLFFKGRPWGRGYARHPRRLILFYLVVSYFLATAAFYILARFRLPSVPLLAVGAGGFAGVLFSEIGRRKWETVVRRSVIPLLLGLFFVFSAYDSYRYSLESRIMRLVRPYGVRSVLDKAKILYLDNGPLTFGSWTPSELREGRIFAKRFVLRDPTEAAVAKFAVPIVCESPGKIKLEVNGVSHSFEMKYGMNEKIFELPVSSPDMKISVRVASLGGKASFILDCQRDYGRTEIDGKDPGAELVSKLYLEHSLNP